PVPEVLEAPGHAEVEGKPAAVVDFGKEMLAVTASAHDRSAFERAGEAPRGGAFEDLGRGDGDALYLFVQAVSLQVPAVVLDVRKLGHVPLLAYLHHSGILRRSEACVFERGARFHEVTISGLGNTAQEHSARRRWTLPLASSILAAMRTPNPSRRRRSSAAVVSTLA